MADDLEVWRERTPARRPLNGRQPLFGAAREAEQLREGNLPPSAYQQRQKPPGRSTNGYSKPNGNRTWADLAQPFANRERRPTDVWHGFMCRFGRHDLRGGHTMQMSGRTVLVERRCHWCGSKADFS